jgi:hypothetical protein
MANSGPSGYCPIGHMCGAGDEVPTSCPETQYQSETGAASCLYCPPGSYCTGGSHIEVCDEGYYCSKRSSMSAPDVANAPMGGICPAKHFCASGTSQPLICPDGFIQRKVGKAYCDKCPPGYTCKQGEQERCPAYKVCN